MTIRIGTDCSGIEAPIQALMQLGIPFEHKWACEKDKFARQSIEANYKPEKMYLDITTRDHSTLPDIDMYVCGFPCQPFSLMGSQRGTNDPRGNIMNHCIEVINTKLPKFFILENVKNFKTIQDGKPFNYLLTQLETIGKYSIHYDIFNTKDYGNPQNRERLYIIGIKRDLNLKEYTKPDILPMRSLDDFIIDKTITNKELSESLKKNINKIKNINNDSYIVTPFTYYSAMAGLCPTLTTRCDVFFHSKYRRYLTTKECLLLQGFDINFKQVVSNTQMFKQTGNSMSVNVLKEIMKQILNA